MHAVTRGACSCAAALALSFVASRASAAPSRFELEPTIGYAATITTGLSPYGAFVGLGVRARAVAHLWLATSLSSYVGSNAAGDGPVTYRARDHAYGLAVDATWRFALGRFFFDPGVEAGGAWILGSTYVTPARVTDAYVAGNVGPVLRAVVRVGPIALGAAAAALLVPSAAAAPVIRTGALVAVPF